VRWRLDRPTVPEYVTGLPADDGIRDGDQAGSPGRRSTLFTAASGNVGCLIDVDHVRCGIRDKDWSPPPRPAACEGDYGYNIALEPGGRAEFVCAGDSVLGEGGALADGESIGAGPLRCESEESSIACRDVDSGRGFSMSREAYQLF